MGLSDLLRMLLGGGHRQRGHGNSWSGGHDRDRHTGHGGGFASGAHHDSGRHGGRHDEHHDEHDRSRDRHH